MSLPFTAAHNNSALDLPVKLFSWGGYVFFLLFLF